MFHAHFFEFTNLFDSFALRHLLTSLFVKFRIPPRRYKVNIKSWQRIQKRIDKEDEGYYTVDIGYRKRGENMTKENKKLLKETTEILKQLDRNSLELIRTGAVLLRTRDAMESQDQKTA
nr:MAG TPA: hypothetical protein [Caudoviricetes sp.]